MLGGLTAKGKIWLTIGLVAACVSISESALRYFCGLGNPVTVSTDKNCEYIITPNQHKLRFGKHIDINEFGMRSGPIHTRRPEELRILLVGDSVLYGTSRVGQEQIFTGLLERDLPTKLHRPVEILNASASAWAISNEVDYIRSRGIFGAGLVLLVLNSADLSQPRAKMNGVGELPARSYPCAWCEVWERFLKPKVLQQNARKDAGTTVENDPQQIQRNLQLLEEFRSIVTTGRARMGIIFVAVREYVPEHAEKSAPDSLFVWAQARQVPLLDLTRFETRFRTRDFTLDGIHLSILGNKVVATAIENDWKNLDPQDL